MINNPTSSKKNPIINSSSRNNFFLGIALSIISGVFLYLAFPPVNFWPLIWIAITPYLVAQYRFIPRKYSALAPAIAAGIWLWPFLYGIFDIEGAPLYIQHLGLLVAIFTYFTSSERKFNELTGFRWFILQGMVAWVGFEMIRTFIPFLGTMGFAANPLAGQAWLIQPVSILSIYALNLLIVLVNFVLALLIMCWLDRKWPLADVVPVDNKSTRRWTVAAVVVLLVWVAGSLVIYNQPMDSTAAVRVAALHMDLDGPGHQVDDAGQAQRMQRLIELVHQAADEGAEIVYVPEMAFGFDPQQKYTEELRALTAETNVYLYFTYAYFDGGWHNETVLISPTGEFFPIYGKQHAFGEPPTASAGPSPVNQTPYGVLASIICMDGVFTDSARQMAANGAQILAIPTYNSTVGISEQNWTHFVFRSVENQLPVINADRGLYTMITDSHGKILTDIRTPQGSSDVVIADVVPASSHSLYTSLGDILGWVSLVGFVFFMFFQSIVENRAKKDASK